MKRERSRLQAVKFLDDFEFISDKIPNGISNPRRCSVYSNGRNGSLAAQDPTHGHHVKRSHHVCFTGNYSSGISKLF